MNPIQKEIILPPFSRGVHLITNEISRHLNEITNGGTGLLQVFIQHTSAGLAINENADPTVRTDMESWMDKNVKENEPYYEHVMEGADDMPAHIKAVLFGNSVTIPVKKGELNMGIWQGVYLGEFRNRGGSRRLVLTFLG